MFIRLLKRVIRFQRRPVRPTPEPQAVPRAKPVVIVPQRAIVPALQGAVFRGRAFIIDGDTLRLGQTCIRLAGIDAPELDQPWGNKSKWELVSICKGQIITARATGVTSYKRVVATCYLPDGTDVGGELVRRGLALDFTPFSGGKYRRVEPWDARSRFRTLDFGQKRMVLMIAGRSRPPNTRACLEVGRC